MLIIMKTHLFHIEEQQFWQALPLNTPLRDSFKPMISSFPSLLIITLPCLMAQPITVDSSPIGEGNIVIGMYVCWINYSVHETVPNNN